MRYLFLVLAFIISSCWVIMLFAHRIHGEAGLLFFPAMVALVLFSLLANLWSENSQSSGMLRFLDSTLASSLWLLLPLPVATLLIVTFAPYQFGLAAQFLLWFIVGFYWAAFQSIPLGRITLLRWLRPLFVFRKVRRIFAG